MLQEFTTAEFRFLMLNVDVSFAIALAAEFFITLRTFNGPITHILSRCKSTLHSICLRHRERDNGYEGGLVSAFNQAKGNAVNDRKSMLGKE